LTIRTQLANATIAELHAAADIITLTVKDN